MSLAEGQMRRRGAEDGVAQEVVLPSYHEYIRQVGNESHDEREFWFVLLG